MLNIMRKQAGSWIIKILLFAIVVVFVFWGVGRFDANRDNTVADVNGEIITYQMYRNAYEQLRERYRRVYGDALNDEVLKSLRLNEQALNQIVNRTVMLQEAERLNIRVAEKTVDEAIYRIPALQTNGVFDEQRAKMVLAQNRMSTADFRNIFRQDLIIDKLQTLIMAGVVATEAEAKEWYDWFNAEIELEVVHFPPSAYKNIAVADEQIAEYFKSHENDYRTEAQVKVRYLFFDPEKFKDQVSVGSDQIAEYYSTHAGEFTTEKTVQARHILLQVDENADPQAVAEKKQQADKIYQLARSGKPFADLAKQYSDGPTREQGGYLGDFKKEDMVQPFSDQAFSMKPGEISEPVRTRFGWHIIKVEKVNEAQTRSLEEASAAIQSRLTEKKARELALRKAEEVYDASLFAGVNLADVAQTHHVPVKTTDFFGAQGPSSDDLGDKQKFTATALGLEKMAVSDIQDLGTGYYLLQVVDRIEPALPALEAVRERVKKDLLAKLQDEKAKTEAEAFLAELRQGKSMSQAAKPSQAQAVETGFFKRTGAIPKIGYEPTISKAAFELGSEKKVPDQALQGQQGWYVIRLKERKLPAADGFQNEKSGIVLRLTEQKKQTVLQQWLADAKARGQIQIKRDLIQ